MAVQTSPWIDKRLDLTEWTMARMVNRGDARGGYFLDGGQVKRTTRKSDGPYWTEHAKALFGHFGATKPNDVVGLHSTSKENTSKWVAFDIDAHTEGQDADINLKAAIEIGHRLEQYKLTGHVFSSDGGGGYHVYAFFEEPIPTPQVFALAKWVAENIKCETFPKQAGIAADGFGNWLRVPGRHHTKDHWHKAWTGIGWADDAGTVDYILRIEGETPVGLPDPVAAAAPVSGAKAEEPYGAGVRLPLRNQTLAVLNDGASEGGRNNALTACAIEMAGNGYSKAAAEERILLAADRCHPPLPHEEARAIVASAYSRPRAPWVDTSMPADPHPTAAADPIITPGPAPKPAADGFRPSVSNIITGRKGQEGETKTYASRIEDIAESINKGSEGWPRRVSSALFVVNETLKPTDLGKGGIRTIGNQGQLFAWLHANFSVNWPTTIRKGCYNQTDDPTTPVNKLELFEHLDATANPVYESVEALPHYPPCQDVYYLPCNLPAATGDALADLCAMFNAETDLDRLLITAALYTPGWGGPCGARPAFVFSSTHGKGVGKSQTAERIQDIWGGYVTLSADKEDWAKAKARLLGDMALSQRCAYIDNAKAKLGGADIESLITASAIDGWKPYVGQFSRPNRLTLFITSNSPRLSSDLSTRIVPILIGRPKYSGNWGEKVYGFIEEHRAQLLADVFAELRGPNKCEIRGDLLDRWALWQRGILTKFEQGNEMAELIASRRPTSDADFDDAEDLRDAIESEVALKCLPKGKAVWISSESMRHLMVGHNLLEKKFTVKGTTTTVCGMLGSKGPLSGLSKFRTDKSKGWMWIPDGVKSTEGYETLVVQEP